ncbi:hypothetical protein ACRAVF_19135 [Bradyrhizobium oligotrophicum S58]
MSSKHERRTEREAQREAEQAARRAEERRKDALEMWERINESDASDDVKDILHRMAQHMGLRIMTATILQFPAPFQRLRTVTIESMDGSPFASGQFPAGEVTRAWMWIEDRVRDQVGPCDVGVADDDVLTADGMPVARVVL